MSDLEDRDRRLRRQINISANLIIALSVLLFGFLVFQLVSYAMHKEDLAQKEEAECLQPLRESWDAGTPRWEILEDCEYRSGRYGGIFGSNARAREWIRWEGRERAWIAARGNANQLGTIRQDELKQIIEEAIQNSELSD